MRHFWWFFEVIKGLYASNIYSLSIWKLFEKICLFCKNSYFWLYILLLNATVSLCKSPSTQVVMAHRLSLRERRSTTTAIFLLPFCENAFFMKESPPQMSPPASQLALQHDKSLRNAADPDKIFPRLNPIALAALYSNTLGLYCVYERAVLLTWFLWAPNGRSSSSTNMENMAPSLCVSAQPLHCMQ